MKRFKNIQTVFVAMGLVLVFYSCCRDDDNTCSDPTNPECENYDPCWDLIPTANFKMRGSHPSFSTPENLVAEWCDTIYSTGVEFVAEMAEADLYEWYIGTETQPRLGKSFKLGFNEYYQDTLQNINPENPDYYLPLNITLKVKNKERICVGASDTLLTMTRKLVFSRKTLVEGTFIGRIEGETFDRQVTFWQNGEDQSQTSINFKYYSDVIGLNPDTIRYYGIMVSFDVLSSYKRLKWEENQNGWWVATDGIQVWDQEIISSASGADTVELYYERYPEGSEVLEVIRFSGYRIE